MGRRIPQTTGVVAVALVVLVALVVVAGRGGATTAAAVAPSPIDRPVVSPVADALAPFPVPAVVVPDLAPSTLISDDEVAVVDDVRSPIAVRAVPDHGAPELVRLDAIDEFGQLRSFRVLGDHGPFLRVQVAMRPNGAEGYIEAADVDRFPVRHRMRIDLSDRSVVVWEGDEVVLDTTAAVGRAGTPTPTGSFYVRSILPWDPASVYGPFVLPLSAYSEAIDRINGGDAVIAIHGTHQPELVGQAASLGCIRLDNDTVAALAAIVTVGTPVEVVP